MNQKDKQAFEASTEMIGKRFSRLTALRFHGRDKNRNAVWVCVCDCNPNKEILVMKSNLISGGTMSCGCLLKQLMSKVKTTHGMTRGKDGKTTRVYGIWAGMIKRCTKTRSKDFPEYGGRGISVCERWMSFENFLQDMGLPPDGHSIDRIDTNGNYEPKNCRWANQSIQSFNRRSQSNNKSGRTGVVWKNADKRWIAQIYKNNKQIYGGAFVEFDDAVKCRERLEALHFGEIKSKALESNGVER